MAEIKITDNESIESALRRVLESAAGLGDSAAAVLLLPQPDGEPIVATFGLSAEESSREVLGLPPGGGDARAVTLVYKYTPEEEARDEFRLSGGLALPILGRNGGSLGTLDIFCVISGRFLAALSHPRPRPSLCTSTQRRQSVNLQTGFLIASLADSPIFG